MTEWQPGRTRRSDGSAYAGLSCASTRFVRHAFKSAGSSPRLRSTTGCRLSAAAIPSRSSSSSPRYARVAITPRREPSRWARIGDAKGCDVFGYPLDPNHPVVSGPSNHSAWQMAHGAGATAGNPKFCVHSASTAANAQSQPVTEVSRCPLFPEDFCGAQGRNRTTDTVIFSHVLYQLSYLGAGSARMGRSARRGRYKGSNPHCPERLSSMPTA